MSKDGNGDWSTTLSLPTGTYGYKFVINEKQWEFDPTNPLQKVVGTTPNSAIDVVEEKTQLQPAAASPAIVSDATSTSNGESAMTTPVTTVLPSPPPTIFLAERVSFSTSSGVTGVPPGTRIQVIEDQGERLLVKATDDLPVFGVPRSALTTDAKSAEDAVNRDYTAQLSIQQMVAQEKVNAQEQKMHPQASGADIEVAAAMEHTQRGGTDFTGWWSNSSANPLNRRPRGKVSNALAQMEAAKRRLSRDAGPPVRDLYPNPLTAEQQKENNIHLQHERDAIGRQMQRSAIDRPEYNQLRSQFESIENTLRERKGHQPGIGSFDVLTPSYPGDRQ